MKIDRHEAGCILTVTKQRDGEDGQRFGFTLEAVRLGTTPKGFPVESAVAVPADLSAIKAAKAAQPAGRVQRVVLQSVETLISEDGVEENPDGPGWPERGRYRIVAVETVIEQAKGRLDPPKGGAKDRRRERIRRALDALEDKGAIGRNQDHLWLIHGGGQTYDLGVPHPPPP